MTILSPNQPRARPDAGRPDEPARSQPGRRPPTVLAVFADRAPRALVETLGQTGCAVIAAHPDQDILRLVTKHRVDVLILGPTGRDESSADLCRGLRQARAVRRLPVVLFDPDPDAARRTEAFAAGADDVWSTPPDPAEVRAKTAAWARFRRLGRAHAVQSRRYQTLLGRQKRRLNQVRAGQKRLLSDPAQLAGITAAVRYQPALEAGGDFYEIMKLSDDSFGFFVADVSGHDLSIAYLTGALKALCAGFVCDNLSVEETAVLLNASLRRFLDPGRFATAFYVKFCRSTMTLDAVCAGHPSPLLQPVNGAEYYLDLTGHLLGVVETVTCQSTSVGVQRGDRMFLYTDGLIESYPDPEGKRGNAIHGAECLAESARRLRGRPLQEAVDGIVDDLMTRTAGQLGDDVILLGVEF